MLESTEKLDIDQVDNTIEDLVVKESKFNQKENILHPTAIFWRYFPWNQILKCTKFSQFSMLESTGNIFLHHIYDIKGDKYHSNKKIQPLTKDMMSNGHILGAHSVEPSLEMDLTMA